MRTLTREDFNTLLGVAAVALTLIGIIAAHLIGRRSDRKNRRLAIQTGAFDKPELIVKTLGENESFIIYSPESQTKVFSLIYMTKDISQSDALFIEFPLILHNNGKKSLEDIVISFHFGRDTSHVFPTEFLKLVANPPSVALDRIYAENESGKFITYKIKSLNPDINFEIKDTFRYLLSERNYSDILVTNDKVETRVDWQIGLQYYFHVNITSKDYPPQRLKFELQFLNTDDNQSFMNNYENKILKERKEQLMQATDNKAVLEFDFRKWIFINTEIIDNKELYKIPLEMYKQGFFKGKTLKPTSAIVYSLTC